MADRTQIAVAALVRDGHVLLAHRHPARRRYADCWDLVGGHVEPGESARLALARECREELGVLVHDPTPFPMAVEDPALDVFAFLVTRWEGEPLNAAPEEHDELRWFRPEELADVNLAHPQALSSIVGAVASAVVQPG
jgi:mutator protein MutT